MSIDSDSRQYAATLIRRHFGGNCTLEALVHAFKDSDDPLIYAAVDIVARQPKRGFLGVTDRHWDNVYWPRVLYVLKQLEAGEAGIAPPAPLYPAATPLRLLGIFLFALLFALSGAESIVHLFRHATGIHQTLEPRLA